MITERQERESSLQSPVRPHRLTGNESEATCRELVRRIIASPTFARSERLAALLAHICDLALRGRQNELNEQRIGHVVFGRAEGYDSAIDGIVRSQASRLRQRLELYFNGEGAQEPVRITIPRGRYLPVFESNVNPLLVSAAAERIEAPPQQQTPLLDPTRSRLSLNVWLPAGVLVFLLAGIVALVVYDRSSARPVAEAHSFWGGLFTEGHTTLVVAPDSGLVMFRNMSGKDIGLAEYMDGRYRSEGTSSAKSGISATKQDWLLNLANRRYTSVVDLQSILSLKDRSSRLGGDVAVRYARDLRPEDLKNGNSILLGSAAADPWVELFQRNMNFVLNDGPAETYSVVNRAPRGSEPHSWNFGENKDRQVVGIVAFLPSLSGGGNSLLLEGATMSGTQAAMDFVSDESRLKPFLRSIQLSDGTLPHFEVLLGSTNMGSSAGRSELIAWRVHPSGR